MGRRRIPGKARRKVQDLLGLDESQLPLIWLYDFNSAGKPNKQSATKALQYVAYKSPKPVFTATDEEQNTGKPDEVRVNSKKQCLAFSLAAENSQGDAFRCKKR